MVSAAAWTGESDTGWYTQNPYAESYSISTAAQLAGFTKLVNGGIDFYGKTVTLTNDISLSGSDWTPIGWKDMNTTIEYDFSGTFNGAGYEITGLSIKSSEGLEYIGFFGVLGTESTVKNLRIKDADISVSGSYGCGGLVGLCTGKVINCHVTGTIKSDAGDVGGLIGRSGLGKLTIQSCYSDASVSGKNDVGGLVGSYQSGSSIINSYSYGKVTGEDNVGGLMGYCFLCEIENCFSTAQVFGTGNNGGLIGESRCNTFFNCYAAGAVSGGKAGGFVGSIYSTDTLLNCYYNTTNSKAIGGVCSYSDTSKLTGLAEIEMKSKAFSDTLNSGISGLPGNYTVLQWTYDGGYPKLAMLPEPEAAIYKGNATGTTQTMGTVSGNNHFALTISDHIIKAPVKGNVIEASAANTYISGTDITGADALVNKYICLYELDADNKAIGYVMFMLTQEDIREENDLSGNGSKQNPFRISSENDLKLLCQDVNNGISYKDKYLILTNDITVSQSWTPIGKSSTKYFAGIFDGCGFTVSGITAGTKDNTYNDIYTGFFGWVGSSARIMNLGIDININASGNSEIGGMAGMNYGVISNCHVLGDFTTAYANMMGGIVGSNVGKIKNCYFTGKMSGRANCTGGIAAGDSSGEILNCYSLGSISGMFLYMGGIIGLTNATKITNCYIASEASNPSTSSIYGGLIGCSYYSIINNCYYINNGFFSDIGEKIGYNESNIVSMSPDEMKAFSFVRTLNNNLADLDGAMSWLADTASVNEGYPVLTAGVVAKSITLTSTGNVTSINKGDTIQLNTTFYPEDTADKNITWSLSDNTLASISKDGLLTAKETGAVTVTATAASGAFASFAIKIYSGEVAGIMLDRDALTMSVSGAAITLKAWVLPESARNKDVTWNSSNPGVAAVSGGAVTASVTGSAIVTVTTVDGDMSASCKVTVVDALDAIIQSFSASNGTINIVLDKLPYAAPVEKDFTAVYSISGGSLVNIPVTGLIWDDNLRTVILSFIPIARAAQDKSVSISITYKNDLVKAKAFTVQGAPVTKIAVRSAAGEAGMMVGTTLQMLADVLPADAADTSVTWSVVNGSQIAKISAEGLLTAIRSGTVTVKASANDGSGVSGTKDIIIYEWPSPDISPNSSEDNGNEKNIIHIPLSDSDNYIMKGEVTLPVPMEELERVLSDPNTSEVVIEFQIPDGLKNVSQNMGFILSTEVLNAVSTSGKSLSVTIKNAKNPGLYTWTFDGKNLASEARKLSDVNLYMERSKSEEDSDLINLIGKDAAAQSLIIRFADKGMFSAQAAVKIYVGDQKEFSSGSKIFLYHYNRETDRLETLPYSSNYLVDTDGYVTVNLVDFSDYVIMLHEADAQNITSLRNQIKAAPKKKILYIGTTDKNTVKMQIDLPKTLEMVDSLSDRASQSAIGGVTVTFSSDNEKVAVVDREGNITAVGTGKAVITALLKLYSGKTRTIRTAIAVKNP